MSYLSLAPYLRPEFPVYKETAQSVGYVFSYRGPAATIAANKPVMFETWADGRKVRSIELTPSIDNSGYSDLVIDTTYSYETSEVSSPTLESERYQVRWMPHELPLMNHPGFAPGGVSDLTTSAGSPSRTGYADVYGWEDEVDPLLRGARKYRPIINGVPSTTVYDVSQLGALAYIKLRQLGFTSYTDFCPVWTKVSVYNGTSAPGVGACGQYTTTPSGSGYPSGYEWIKSGDNAERIGNQPKWQRTEEWTGFNKVYFDTDTLNPASHTLP